MTRGQALAVALAFGLSGCSSFNMTPACADTGLALKRTLVVPNGDRPDDVRLARIMIVSVPHEVHADYNRRTCSAEITAFGQKRSITYDIRQSEGVRNWIEVTLPDDPAIAELQRELRVAYEG